MKLAIMQPYFFPYIGYFQLINSVDKWLVFDNIQYIRHGWVNRNRILSPNLKEEWQYINIPIKKHKRDDLIKDIYINNNIDWKKNIFGKITYYKKIAAPYYKEVVGMLENCLDGQYSRLVDINVYTLKHICDYLGVQFEFKICSEYHFDFTNVRGPGDWAFEITRQVGADLYINPIGGRDIFDVNKFNSAGIEIRFLEPKENIYIQSCRKYVPWLSIIDVMMFNSIKEISEMLDEVKLF